MSGENKVIPPDPEMMNSDRARWARVAVEAFIRETGVDEEDAIPDLLADLMHLCDRSKGSHGFEAELAVARHHYAIETKEP